MGRARRLRAALLALRPADAAAEPTDVHTMRTVLGTPLTDGPRRQHEQRLSDLQRDECLAALDRDSYAVLPVKLPQDMIDRAQAHIDGFCADESMYLAANTSYRADDPRLFGQGFHSTNIIETNAVFREFLVFKPAMQLCYDVFGPMFHLGQVRAHPIRQATSPCPADILSLTRACCWCCRCGRTSGRVR